MVGNVGDSRVTRGFVPPTSPSSGTNPTLHAQAVSADHKPDLPLEKARIEAAGGRVFAVEYDDGIDGPPRVWLGNMDVPGTASIYRYHSIYLSIYLSISTHSDNLKIEIPAWIVDQTMYIYTIESVVVGKVMLTECYSLFNESMPSLIKKESCA